MKIGYARVSMIEQDLTARGHAPCGFHLETPIAFEG
jgi:hypothetical protein